MTIAASKPGRRPTPTKLKLLRGNPGCRPLNDKEPEYATTDIKPPSYLKGRQARKEWTRLATMLDKVGLYTDADQTALALYCNSFQTYCDAWDSIRREGMIVQTGKYPPGQNPNFVIANKAHEQMVKMMAEFGFTPSSRTRVQTEKPGQGKPDNPYEGMDPAK